MYYLNFLSITVSRTCEDHSALQCSILHKVFSSNFVLLMTVYDQRLLFFEEDQMSFYLSIHDHVSFLTAFSMSLLKL